MESGIPDVFRNIFRSVNAPLLFLDSLMKGELKKTKKLEIMY